jgi:hypothetical protein
MSEWYEQLLDLQLQRNRDAWAKLREHDIADDSKLRLGFVYLAPAEPQARELAAFLQAETDYDVRARTRPEDAAWVVVGTTQPTPVSLELLDEWVTWMIAVGAAEGPCAFDRWAAQLVGDEPDPWLRSG